MQELMGCNDSTIAIWFSYGHDTSVLKCSFFLKRGAFQSKLMTEFLFSTDFQSAECFCIPLGSLLFCRTTTKPKDGNWEPVMGRWRKEGAVNSSPLPLPVLHQPLDSLLQCLTSLKRRPMRALGHPRFSSQAPPLSMVPYISPVTTFSTVYNVLPESQQAVYRETAREEGRERESVSGFQRWLRSIHPTRCSHCTSLVSFRPPSPFSVSLISTILCICSVPPGQNWLETGFKRPTLQRGFRIHQPTPLGWAVPQATWLANHSPRPRGRRVSPWKLVVPKSQTCSPPWSVCPRPLEAWRSPGTAASFRLESSRWWLV